MTARRRVHENRTIDVRLPAGHINIQIVIDWSKATEDDRKLIEAVVDHLFALAEDAGDEA